MASDRLVVVERYLNASQAQLACHFLNAIGIEAVVSADDCGGMEPYIQMAATVRLLVSEADYKRAREALEADARKEESQA